MATSQNDHQLPSDLLKAIQQFETKLLEALAMAGKPLGSESALHHANSHQPTPRHSG